MVVGEIIVRVQVPLLHGDRVDVARGVGVSCHDIIVGVQLLQALPVAHPAPEEPRRAVQPGFVRDELPPASGLQAPAANNSNAQTECDQLVPTSHRRYKHRLLLTIVFTSHLQGRRNSIPCLSGRTVPVVPPIPRLNRNWLVPSQRGNVVRRQLPSPNVIETPVVLLRPLLEFYQREPEPGIVVAVPIPVVFDIAGCRRYQANQPLQRFLCMRFAYKRVVVQTGPTDWSRADQATDNQSNSREEDPGNCDGRHDVPHQESCSASHVPFPAPNGLCVPH